MAMATSGGSNTDRVCCIVVCPNAKPGANPTVGYHPFPTDDAALRRLWIAFVGPSNQERFRWRGKYICSEHFQAAEVIAREDGQKALLENSIPTIFTVEEDDADEEDDDPMDITPLELKPEINVANISAPAEEPPSLLLSESQELIEEEIEVRSLFCRICLGKHQHQTEMVPLSSRLREHRLVDMIFAVTGLRMKAEGIVPNRVCPECVTKVDLAYGVREEFLRREKILRDMLVGGQLEQYYNTHVGSPTELPNQSYLNGLIADAKAAEVKQVEMPKIQVLAMEAIEPAPVALVLPIEETIIEEIPISMEEEHLYEVDGEIISIEDESTTIALTEEVADEEDDVDSEYSNAESYYDDPVTDRFEQPKAEEEKIVKPVGKVEPSMKGPPIQNAIIPESTAKNQKLDQPSTSRSTEPSYVVRPTLMDPKSCHICFSHLPSHPALAAHLNSHAGMLPYKCKRCSSDGTAQQIETVAALNEHVGRHQFPFQCGFCDKRFSGENALFEHMRAKHDGESTTDSSSSTAAPSQRPLPQSGGFTCTTCGQHFAKRALYRHHMTRHEALEDERFKCEDCGRVFGSALLLRLHRKIHTGEWKGFVTSRANNNSSPYGMLGGGRKHQHHGKGG